MNALSEGIAKSAEDLRENELEVALQRVDDLSTAHPNCLDLLLNKSTISVASNDMNEALALLRKALEMDPFDFRTYYNMFVVHWRMKDYSLAELNFRKCLSLLYTLMAVHRFQENTSTSIDRSLELWQQNTASYALKTIKLIEEDKLMDANEVAKSALEKCIVKHHMFALCCIIDSRLNRQAQREQNAKDYHAHLLRSQSLSEHSAREMSNEEAVNAVKRLIMEFNDVNSKCEVASYQRYENQPGIAFMTVVKSTSINIQFEISRVLGSFDLACIKEDKDEEAGEEGEKVEQPEDHYEELPTKAKQSKDMLLQKSSSKSSGEDVQMEKIEPNDDKFGTESRSLEQNMFKDNKDLNEIMHGGMGWLNQIPDMSHGKKPEEKPSQWKMDDDEEEEKEMEKEKEKEKKVEGKGSMLGEFERDIQRDLDKRNEQRKEEIRQKQKRQRQEAASKPVQKQAQPSPKTEELKQQPSPKSEEPKEKPPPKSEQPKQKPTPKPKEQSPPKPEPERPHIAGQEQLLYPITHLKFQIKLIMADLQISQELIGKMDPYVYYEYGSQKHKSTIAKGQGLHPRWQNDITLFSLERNPTNMKVSVYDRQIFKWDDLVGEGTFNVVKTGVYTLPIFLKGKQSGEVVFHLSKKT